MSDNNMNSQRRQFLKISGVGIAALALANRTQANPAAAKLDMVKEADA